MVTMKDFEKMLYKKLEIEEQKGFRHSVVLLQEIIAWYEEAKKQKKKKCVICGAEFTPNSGAQKKCDRCRGLIEDLVEKEDK